MDDEAKNKKILELYNFIHDFIYIDYTIFDKKYPEYVKWSKLKDNLHSDIFDYISEKYVKE